MTLNIMWSDRDRRNAFLLVDSAATHARPPRFPISLVGHTQWQPHRLESVEEGYRKIVPLSAAGAVVLCGEASELHKLVGAFQRDLGRGGTIDAATAYFESIPDTANFAVTLAAAMHDPPFTVIAHPEREVTLVQHGHIHVEGSLPDAPRGFLVTGIQRFLLDNAAIPPEARLAGALGFAMATAIEWGTEIVEQGVGGAFFGARLSRSGFHWQPDIVYYLYDHGVFDDTPRVSVLTAETPGMSPPPMIHCRVRDDVCVATSSLEMRTVAAGPTMSADDEAAWIAKWRPRLAAQGVGNARYYVFVPTSAGTIVVVPRHRALVRILPGQVAFSTVLAEAIRERPPDDKYGFTYLAPPEPVDPKGAGKHHRRRR